MPEIIEEQWGPYQRLIPFNVISAKIALPRSLMKEAIRSILPSVGIGPDGQVVESLILLTERYICEVRLKQKGVDFDISLAATISNYRVQIDTLEITREEPPTPPSSEKKVTKLAYDHAQVVFRHTIGVHTALTFAGEGRDQWVKEVLAAIPVQRLVSGIDLGEL